MSVFEAALLQTDYTIRQIQSGVDVVAADTVQVKQSVDSLDNLVTNTIVVGVDGNIGNLSVFGDGDIRGNLVVGGLTSLQEVAALLLRTDSITSISLSASDIFANVASLTSIQALVLETTDLTVTGMSELGHLDADEVSTGNLLISGALTTSELTSAELTIQTLTAHTLEAHFANLGSIVASNADFQTIAADSLTCQAANFSDIELQTLSSASANIIAANIGTLHVGQLLGFTPAYYSYEDTFSGFQRSAGTLPCLRLAFEGRASMRVDLKVSTSGTVVHTGSFGISPVGVPVVQQITNQFKFEVRYDPDPLVLYFVPSADHLVEGVSYDVHLGTLFPPSVSVTEASVVTSFPASEVNMPLVVGPELIVPDLGVLIGNSSQEANLEGAYSQNGSESVQEGGGLLVSSLPKSQVVVLDVWLDDGRASHSVLINGATPLATKFSTANFHLTYLDGAETYDVHISPPEAGEVHWGLSSLATVSVSASGPSSFARLPVASNTTPLGSFFDDQQLALQSSLRDIQAQVAAIELSLQASNLTLHSLNANSASFDVLNVGSFLADSGSFNSILVADKAPLFESDLSDLRAESSAAQANIAEFEVLIKDLSANLANIDQAIGNLSINSLVSNTANILTLSAGNANVTFLRAADANLGNLVVAGVEVLANIAVLELANAAVFSSLGELQANINTLELLVKTVESNLANQNQFERLEANVLTANFIMANLAEVSHLFVDGVSAATVADLEANVLFVQNLEANVTLLQAQLLALEGNVGDLGSGNLTAGAAQFDSLLVGGQSVVFSYQLEDAQVELQDLLQASRLEVEASIQDTVNSVVDLSAALSFTDANVEELRSNLSLAFGSIAQVQQQLDSNSLFLEGLVAAAEANIAGAKAEAEANVLRLEAADAELLGALESNVQRLEGLLTLAEANLAEAASFANEVLAFQESNFSRLEDDLVVVRAALEADIEQVESNVYGAIAANVSFVEALIASLDESTQSSIDLLTANINAFSSGLAEVSGNLNDFENEVRFFILPPIDASLTALQANDNTHEIRLGNLDSDVVELQANGTKFIDFLVSNIAATEELLSSQISSNVAILRGEIEANTNLIQVGIQDAAAIATQAQSDIDDLEAELQGVIIPFQRAELSAAIRANLQTFGEWLESNRSEIRQEVFDAIDANLAEAGAWIISNVAATRSLAEGFIEANLAVASGWIEANANILSLEIANATSIASQAQSDIDDLDAEVRAVLLPLLRTEISGWIDSNTSMVAGWIDANFGAARQEALDAIASNLQTVSGWIVSNVSQLRSDVHEDISANLAVVAGWISANAAVVFEAIESAGDIANEALSDVANLDTLMRNVLLPDLEANLIGFIDANMAIASGWIVSNFSAVQDSLDEAIGDVLVDTGDGVRLTTDLVLAGSLECLQGNISNLSSDSIHANVLEANFLIGNLSAALVSFDSMTTTTLSADDATLGVANITGVLSVPGFPDVAATLGTPSDAVLREGDTMTGSLTMAGGSGIIIDSGTLSLPGHPDVAASLATGLSRVNRAGDTMTGTLTFSGAAGVTVGGTLSIPGHTDVGAALDDRLLLSGGTMTGPLTVGALAVDQLQVGTIANVEQALALKLTVGDSLVVGNLEVGNLAVDELVSDQVNVGALQADTVQAGSISVQELSLPGFANVGLEIQSIESALSGLEMNSNASAVETLIAITANVGTLVADTLEVETLLVSNTDIGAVAGYLDQLNLQVTHGDFSPVPQANLIVTGLSLDDVSGEGRDMVVDNGSVVFGSDEGLPYVEIQGTARLRTLAQFPSPVNSFVMSFLVWVPAFSGVDRFIAAIGNTSTSGLSKSIIGLSNNTGNGYGFHYTSSRDGAGEWMERYFADGEGILFDQWNHLVFWKNFNTFEEQVYSNGTLLNVNLFTGRTDTPSIGSHFLVNPLARDMDGTRYSDMRVWWNVDIQDVTNVLTLHARVHPPVMYANLQISSMSGVAGYTYASHPLLVDGAQLHSISFLSSYLGDLNPVLRQSTDFFKINSAISTTIFTATSGRIIYDFPLAVSGTHEILVVVSMYLDTAQADPPDSRSLMQVGDAYVLLEDGSSTLAIYSGSGAPTRFSAPPRLELTELAWTVKYSGGLNEWQCLLAYNGVLQRPLSSPVSDGSLLNFTSPVRVTLGKTDTHNTDLNLYVNQFYVYRAAGPPPDTVFSLLLKNSVIPVSGVIDTTDLIVDGVSLRSKLQELELRVLALETP